MHSTQASVPRPASRPTHVMPGTAAGRVAAAVKRALSVSCGAPSPLGGRAGTRAGVAAGVHTPAWAVLSARALSSSVRTAALGITSPPGSR
jgi:hypothetical protein